LVKRADCKKTLAIDEEREFERQPPWVERRNSEWVPERQWEGSFVNPTKGETTEAHVPAKDLTKNTALERRKLKNFPGRGGTKLGEGEKIIISERFGGKNIRARKTQRGVRDKKYGY